MKLISKSGIEVTDEVSTIKPYEANLNEENRIKYVTDIAAISRGKDSSNNPKKRYEALLKEAAPNIINETNKSGVAGRPFEFLPIVFYINKTNLSSSYIILYKDFNNLTPFANIEAINFFNNILPFSYLEYINDEYIRVYSNMRALLNSNIDYKDIPYNNESELKSYKVIKVKAPYFVFAQLRTHCRLSQIALSERVANEKDERLWLPEDIYERFSEKDNINKLDLNKFDLLKSKYWYILSTKDGKEFLKELGYKKEIYDRFPLFLRFKTWIMGGWLNDEKSWLHLFIERSGYKDFKNWTQETTKETATLIRNIILEV